MLTEFFARYGQRVIAMSILVFLFYFGSRHGGKVITYVQQYTMSAAAASELGTISRQVRAHVIAGNPVPHVLKAFLAGNYQKGAPRQAWQDPWMRDYVIEKTFEGFIVRSSGPDRRMWTKDDIKNEVVTKNS